MDADTYNDEYRSAVASLSEFERVQTCRHNHRGHSVCPDCGHDAREEL